mmetsp:Transcript_62942/g.172500  ORF Transcript_62942/g.172500 Transcript_62942/m.172500 type:complete len:223 (+) Transcript_62942:922-1590(+)
MDVRVPWFFASTQMQHREPGLVMERFQTRCRSSHSRYGKHMVQMRPHTPLACGHPHFCQGAKSKKEAEPGAMFVVHYATRSFEEFTGKPQRKVGGGLGRNHTFEFFAKNSCRWTMSKDQRTRERRMKNFPPFNPKGASGMYDSLKTELGRSDRTVRLGGDGHSNSLILETRNQQGLHEHRSLPRSLGTCPGHCESVRRRHGAVHFRHELGAMLPSGCTRSAT